MNLDNIDFGGLKLGENPTYADAVTYLNAKFAPMSEEQVKEWLMSHGTSITDVQANAVSSDVIFGKVTPIKDPKIIYHIEEILIALVDKWGLSPSHYYN